MTLNGSVNYLIQNGYLTVIDGELTITGKLRRDFAEVERERIVEEKKLAGREFFHKFAEDSKVPSFIHMSNGAKFTVKYYTPSVLGHLKRAINEVGYEKLTEITENYYKQQNLARTTLQKFLSQGIWRDWIRIAPTTSPGGENRFEE